MVPRILPKHHDFSPMPERPTLFGTDLKLGDRFGGFDLLPSAVHNIDVATGNDNIIQALILRLRVRQGELAPLGWPAYGSRIHELIGELNIPRTHLKLMAFARNALLQDPRVEDILDIRAQVLPGERTTVRLLIDIQLIDQPTPLNLVYDVNLEAP